LATIAEGRTVLGQTFVAIAMTAALAGLPAVALGCDGLVDGPGGIVTGVPDGDTVLLDSGARIRLAGIQAPRLPLGRENFVAWPLADDARAALSALVLGKPVLLRYGGARSDRHGRMLGQLFVGGGDGAWVQQEMVDQGMARVYSFPDNRACMLELLAAEGRARTMRTGLWSDPYYAVRRADRPDEIVAHEGRFELVEGRVLDAEATGGRVYLNFGRFWKEDVTAVIDTQALRLFKAVGLDPARLGGALVRVRGWIESRDGPRIAISHPEQIEVLATP
jgi:endonuclease YncB( thermonuclease family)